MVSARIGSRQRRHDEVDEHEKRQDNAPREPRAAPQRSRRVPLEGVGQQHGDGRHCTHSREHQQSVSRQCSAYGREREHGANGPETADGLPAQDPAEGESHDGQRRERRAIDDDLSEPR